jgi:hypothetical protein
MFFDFYYNTGFLGTTVVKERCGGVLMVEPPKHPHIPCLSRRFPKTLKIYPDFEIPRRYNIIIL